jgi:hypothetical protein
MPFYNANLPAGLLADLKTFARESGMPMAEVMRRALRMYLQWQLDQRLAVALRGMDVARTGSDHTNAWVIEEAAGMVAHLKDDSEEAGA